MNNLVGEFLTENQEKLTNIFKKGESLIIIGGTQSNKSGLLNEIKYLWMDHIPTESLYEACVDVETITSARILVDCKERISYLVADYDSIKYTERFLSTDFNIAQQMSKGSNHIGLLTSVYPASKDCGNCACTEEIVRDEVMESLKNALTGAQLKALTESTIHIIYFDKEAKLHLI